MSALCGLHDDRGNLLGTGCEDASLAADLALWRMVTGNGSPSADLQSAVEFDPAWALPQLMRAGHRLLHGSQAERAQAAQDLDHAKNSGVLDRAPAREQVHAQALSLLSEGHARAACRLWDRLLVEQPCDLLALHWAQRCDLLRGEPAQLALRPARALPEWDEDDALYPQVLGLWAAGLQEHGALAEAEDAARRALALDPQVTSAVHAVAHVMHQQGRFDDGAAWLRHHQPHWQQADAAGGEAPAAPPVPHADAVHLWSHTALFRLEGLDIAGALRIVDGHLTPAHIEGAQDAIDAATVLWRLHLLGADVAERAAQIVRRWDATAGNSPLPPGAHTLFDLHCLLLYLAADDVAAAERRVAQVAERLMGHAQARTDEQAVAREVGLPLARAFLAFARGEHEVAADALFAVRHSALRCGGTRIEREVIDHTLMAACAQGQRVALGRAIANEHALLRAITPLSGHWADTVSQNTRRLHP